MKTLLSAAAAALCLLGASAANADVVVNFDDLAPGYTTVPDFYAGIDWQNNFVYYTDAQDPYNASSGSGRIFGNYDKFPCCDLASMGFKVGAGSIFSGAFFAGNGAEVKFEMYNGGSLVATSNTLTISSTPTFLASGYAGEVDEIRFIAPNGYWVADDLTFASLNGATGGVPEPATWALLIGGFGATGAMLRRRRVAAAAA